ncbi:MAG: ATP-binding protein [Anaerolineae bacterium]|nr:ATP-binding protein [Anaerolineae bacterium]
MMKHLGVFFPQNTLNNLLNKLLEPSASIPKEQALSYRLLAGIILLLIVLSFVIGIVISFISFGLNTQTFVSIASFFMLVSAYLVLASGRYLFPAVLIIGIVATSPMFTVIVDVEQYLNSSALGLSTLAVLLTAILFPNRRSILLSSAWVGILLLSLLVFLPITITDLVTPLAVLVAAIGFTLVFDSHRNALEQLRRQELVAINESLQVEIEERKRIEESQARLVAIVETTSDLVGSASLDGHPSYINRAGRQMIGLDLDADISDMMITDISPAWANEIIGQIGVPIAMSRGTWTGETALLGRDGREIPVSQTIIAHRDANGNPTYLSTMMRDITAQKEANAQLAANAKRIRDIFDNLAIFALMLDPDGKVVEVNQPIYAITELKPNEVINSLFPNTPWFGHSSEMRDLASHLVQQASQGKLITVEMSAIVAHGLIIDVLVTVGPLLNDHGKVINLVASGVDITALKQAEQEQKRLIKDLQAAKRLADENSRLKSEFLSTMSHELRTPMNAIEGFTGIILKKMGGADFNAKTEEYLHRVHSNSRRLLQLINDFLDLSRVESGRLELAHQPFAPAHLAQRWRDEISVLAEKKNIAFEVAVDPDLPSTLYGDEEAISKVTINLLSNAIKFTEQGGITLKLEARETTWNIMVSDTGIGIPPHARDFIFEEFRQVDQSSKRKYGGTGLGLAIVQKYARSMGGNVSVKSELGQGSTFTVTLPLHIAE